MSDLIACVLGTCHVAGPVLPSQDTFLDRRTRLALTKMSFEFMSCACSRAPSFAHWSRPSLRGHRLQALTCLSTTGHVRHVLQSQDMCVPDRTCPGLPACETCNASLSIRADSVFFRRNERKGLNIRCLCLTEGRRKALRGLSSVFM